MTTNYVTIEAMKRLGILRYKSKRPFWILRLEDKLKSKLFEAKYPILFEECTTELFIRVIRGDTLMRYILHHPDVIGVEVINFDKMSYVEIGLAQRVNPDLEEQLGQLEWEVRQHIAEGEWPVQ